MGLGDRWQRWWNRLTGGPSDEARAGFERRSAGNGAAPRSTAGGARTVGKVPTASDGELKLSVEPKNRPIRQRGKVRSAGFDPYSNDAGYEKPRNWDEVDPR